VHTTAASIVSATSNGLRFNLVAEEDATDGAAVLFARIEAPPTPAEMICDQIARTPGASLSDVSPGVADSRTEEVLVMYGATQEASRLLDHAHDALHHSVAADLAAARRVE